MCLNGSLGKNIRILYTVKKSYRFSIPSQDVANQTLSGRELLIIPGQGEFDLWNPGWGWEKR